MRKIPKHIIFSAKIILVVFLTLFLAIQPALAVSPEDIPDVNSDDNPCPSSVKNEEERSRYAAMGCFYSPIPKEENPDVFTTFEEPEEHPDAVDPNNEEDENIVIKVVKGTAAAALYFGWLLMCATITSDTDTGRDAFNSCAGWKK